MSERRRAADDARKRYEALSEPERRLANSLATGIFFGLALFAEWAEERPMPRRRKRKVTTQRQNASSLPEPEKPWYPEYKLPAKRKAGGDE